MIGRRGVAFGFAGLLGAATLAGFLWTRGKTTPSNDGATALGTTEGQSATAPKPGLAKLALGIRQSDASSLATLWDQLNETPKGPKMGLTDEEGAQWIAVLAGLRAGYLKYDKPMGRAAIVASAGKILEKFSVDPAPPCWTAAINPVRDLMIGGLNDPDGEVRATTLGEVAKLWSWAPARTPLPVEERTLAEWKDSFHEPVRRRLGDAEVKVRVGAIGCLGMNPIDSLAAPAVAYIDDSRSGDVRQQVLVAFGKRVNLLSDDAILKRLHDEEPGIPQLAEMILKARGLTREQIFLGKLITNPHPEMRASVIPMLKERADIDPVVWLAMLSRDADESVRAQAVQSLGEHDTPEARERLKEIAAGDVSASIRESASRIHTKLTTAALPPLPGSTRLNPKAN